MRRITLIFVGAVVITAPMIWPVQPTGAQSKTASAGTLVVEVDGFRNSTGVARAGLFRSDEGFPLGVDDVDPKAEAPIEDEKARLEFTDLPHGTYTVVVYHDENGNGGLDKNWAGMPKEGAGIYKPVTSRFPPPNFEDCKFRFGQDEQTVEISLRYR